MRLYKKAAACLLTAAMALSMLTACGGGGTGGNGGGKPDFAMAGAKDLTKIDEALAAVNTIVSEMVKE